MKLTPEEIEEIWDLHKAGASKESRIIGQLCENELNRRKNAGRKGNGTDRKEQNRLAQQRYRNRKDIKEILEKRRKPP